MNSSNSWSLNSISTTCHSGFPNPANLNTRHCSVKVGTVLGNHNFLLWPFGPFWLCTSSLPGTFKLFIVIRIGKLIAKSKSRQYEDGYVDFLETTGQKMVQRAKSLQEHATNIKAEGIALKKKAKTHQK